MEDDILNTIEVLTARVQTKEDEANKLKKLVNELCNEAGVPIRFASIAGSGNVSSLRSDQFYGLPLTAAIRNYLDARKAANLGAATVAEIFRAIKEGGYKFQTKTDDIALTVVRNALRRTSSIFHRLPNGQYGLLSWYPSARQPAEFTYAHLAKRSKSKKKVKTKGKGKESESQAVRLLPAPDAPNEPAKENAGEETVNNEDVRQVITATQGEFQNSDIEKAVKERFPHKRLSESKISTVLFILKKKGLLQEVKPRSGKRGAVFANV